MPVTKDQAQMLAALAVACRPTGAPKWDEPGVIAAIKKHAGLHLADVIHATIRAAEDRTAASPGVLGSTAAAHWRERTPERETFRPPRADEMCQTHGAGYIDTCPGCRADELAAEKVQPRRGPRATPTPEYLAARQALRNHEETTMSTPAEHRARAESHLASANAIALDETVARWYREDVPALLADLDAWADAHSSAVQQGVRNTNIVGEALTVAEVELRELRTRLERAQALPRNWESIRDGVLGPGLRNAAQSLRTALHPPLDGEA